MEIGAISQFLEESGYHNQLNRKLKPPCVFLTSHDELAIYIHDGELCLENWLASAKLGINRCIIQCPLGDPASFDKLLKAIDEQVKARSTVGDGPNSQSNPISIG